MVTINHAQAFSPGADLWILPDYEYTSALISEWTAKVDWQLNFALSKYHSRTKTEISVVLQSVIQQTELPIYLQKADLKSILISTRGLVPAKWCLFYKFDPTSFKDEVLKVAEQLGTSSIRIFWPTNWESEKAQQNFNSETYQFIF